MPDLFWVDGVADAQVPADDRGLALADGAFETLRVVDGHFRCQRLHQDRLAMGLDRLGFERPRSVASETFQSVRRWLGDAALADVTGICRITVTRGSGLRSYMPTATAPRVIVRFSVGLPPERPPVTMVTASVRWSDQPALAGLKLLARTEQVLAALEAKRRGFEDVILCDSRGRWLSSNVGNIFLRKSRQLITPALDSAGIAGTRRRAVIEYWATACGFKVTVAALDLDAISEAEEMFVTNAVLGIRSVTSVDNWVFPSQEAAGVLRPHIHDDYSSECSMSTL